MYLALLELVHIYENGLPISFKFTLGSTGAWDFDNFCDVLACGHLPAYSCGGV